MRKLLLLLAAGGMVCSMAQAQVTLANAGFEAGDLSGWSESPDTGSVGVSTAYAQSGTYSALIDSVGAGAWASPNIFQSFAASEDDEFNMTGSMLANWAGGETFWGVIKIEFKDSGGNNIEPKSVSIGSVDGSGNPWVGAISGLLTPGTAAAESWLDEEVQAVAPAGTVAVNFYLLNVNPGGAAPAAGNVYFDNITATQVPEPSTFALLGGLAALGVVMYRRRRQ